jgi:ABC-type nitrate/sulfonate/bicarbonate transport system ATPase subunit
VKPDEKENISLNVLVETILNYGDEKRVRTLFDLIGVKAVAEIFFRQISGTVAQLILICLPEMISNEEALETASKKTVCILF